MCLARSRTELDTRTERPACRQDSNVDNLFGTGAQGRLIRRKPAHPAVPSANAFALAIFVGLRSGTWPSKRRIQWLV
jgi:hypothetical protein